MSNHLRYSIVNNSFLLVGLTAKNAVPMKPYLGQAAYTISCVRELVRRASCTYDLIFDNGKHKIENLWTQYMQIYNGKFGGGKIMLNPIGILNDGFMELVFYKTWISAAGAINLFCKPHGKLFYDSGFVCYRCKNVKIVNKQVDKTGKKVPQDVNIDGEDLTFTNHI